jgi:hypothetical protein
MTRVSCPTAIAAAFMAAALAFVPALVTAGQSKPAPNASSVKVTVKYTGKGTVDATHRLWVWLFDTPEIIPGSIPIAEQSLEKNGGTAEFANVAAKQVYIAIAYDEGGGFVGQAPPPPGSPVALFGAKGPNDPPVAVTPGPKGSVSLTLTDAQRMQ